VEDASRPKARSAGFARTLQSRVLRRRLVSHIRCSKQVEAPRVLPPLVQWVWAAVRRRVVEPARAIPYRHRSSLEARGSTKQRNRDPGRSRHEEAFQYHHHQLCACNQSARGLVSWVWACTEDTVAIPVSSTLSICEIDPTIGRLLAQVGFSLEPDCPRTVSFDRIYKNDGSTG